MCLLLLERCLADLSMCENADNGTVLLDALEFAVNGPAGLLCVLLGVLGESLLLRFVPVLVEASLDFVAQMLSPDSGKRAKTTRSFDVTHETDDHHLNSSFSSCNEGEGLSLREVSQ